MKKSLFSVFAVCLSMIALPAAMAQEDAASPTSASTVTASATDGAFIHLSSGPENPHRVLMALKMAAVMAEGGKDVLVYCDTKAMELLVKGAPDLTHNGFESSTAMFAKLAEMNVPVRACPSCLAAAGKTEADLLPGVKLADREEFFGFTKGRILTLDY